MGSTVQLHGLLACVPRGWAAEAESSFEHWTALRSRVLKVAWNRLYTTSSFTKVFLLVLRESKKLKLRQCFYFRHCMTTHSNQIWVQFSLNAIFRKVLKSCLTFFFLSSRRFFATKKSLSLRISSSLFVTLGKQPTGDNDRNYAKWTPYTCRLQSQVDCPRLSRCYISNQDVWLHHTDMWTVLVPLSVWRLPGSVKLSRCNKWPSPCLVVLL